MTEAEYLLLCNLLYFKEFSDVSYEGMTVAQIVDYVKISEDDPFTSSREFQDILELARSTPNIADLTVASTYPSDGTDARAACFVIESGPRKGQAIVAFRGTGTDEWPDNVEGANSISTLAQENARAWVESLEYDNIIVTGHSKGGNKAMFVAITCANVTGCYSFDGQGFSQAFIEKYQAEIEAMEGKMHSICHQRDFVNILLYDITGDQRYLANYFDVNGFAEHHTPNALFKYDWYYDEESQEWFAKPVLELAAESNQSALMATLHGYISYLLENQNKKELDKMMEIVSDWADKLLGTKTADPSTFSSLIQGFRALTYFNVYIKQLKEDDPELYEEMLKELYNILVDNFGVSYAEASVRVFENDMVGIVDIIDIINVASTSAPIRDFTAEAKQILLDTVKEVDSEEPINIGRWDIWYRVEKFFGALNVENYADDIATYHRKVIDINGTTAEDIEKLFAEVYEVESTYAGKVKEHASSIAAGFSKLKNAITRLKPAAS